MIVIIIVGIIMAWYFKQQQYKNGYGCAGGSECLYSSKKSLHLCKRPNVDNNGIQLYLILKMKQKVILKCCYSSNKVTCISKTSPMWCTAYNKIKSNNSNCNVRASLGH